MDTASRLRAARGAAGLTQSQLAQLAGIPQPNLSRIEAGRISPRAETVDRLFAAIEAHNGQRPAADAITARPGTQLAERKPGTLDAISLDEDVPEIDWLVDGMVARGYVTMIAGEPGAGKSMWTQNIAATMARGGGFVAGLPVQSGRAAIIDAENGRALIVQRFRKLGVERGVWHRLAIHEAHGFDIELDRDGMVAAVAARPAEHDEHGNVTREGHPAADLLILDSWVSLWTGSEQSVSKVKSCLEGLRDFAQQHNVGILLIHHTTKGADTYRGGGAIAGIIEGVFILVRNDDDPVRGRVIECRKMRLGAEPDPRYMWLTGTRYSATPDEELPAVEPEEEAGEE